MMIDRIIGNIRSLYGFGSARRLVSLYAQADYNPFRYLWRFWVTQNFASIQKQPLKLGGRLLTDLAGIGMLVQVTVGLWLIVHGVIVVEAWQVSFGLAAIISYPLIWAYILPILSLPGLVLRAKPIGKSLLCNLLEKQVVQLRQKHQFALVAVAGSVGKTSTKLAIADALGVARRVQYQTGNYNDRLTVPLIFFGHAEPGIYNVFAWAKIMLANRRMIKQDYPYDIVVVEIGTDAPGQMAKFAYLQPELGVVTSIAPEHMENFADVAAVADEELAVFDYCQRLLVNTEDVAPEYLTNREYVSYGGSDATYALKATNTSDRLGSQRVTFNLAGRKVSESIDMVGLQGAKIALAAAAVASELALSEDDVTLALKHLRPFAGRMQILMGIQKSTIIDDTYNASPLAVKAGLDVLYATPTKQRIALLGNMNELGEHSQKAHLDIGDYCDPAKLHSVVTLGGDANKYLAEAARAKGCEVKECISPYEAGEYIASVLQSGAVVLAEGSQNGVFAEEAIKPLLQNKSDEMKLVRQSDYWMKIKAKQFSRQ